MEKDIEEMTIAEVWEEAKKELDFLPSDINVRNAFGEVFIAFFLFF
jgi:hypothetical protein